MAPSIWLTALLVFTAAVFGTLSIALAWEILRDVMRQRKVGKRIAPVLGGEVSGGDAGLDLVKSFEEDEGPWVKLVSRTPGLRGIDELLAQSNLEWRLETFVLLSAGIAFGAGTAVLLLSGFMVFAFLAAVAGAFTPYMFARSRRKRRFMEFEEQFPEAIDLLTRAIRAGHPLTSGIRMVGDEGPPEVASEFRRTFEEQRFGLPFEDALLGFVDRMNTVDVRIFAIAVLVQREVGGNLAEILDNLAKTIRGRFYIRRQLRVYTAQGRLSGYVLAALPIVVGTILFIIQPDYVGLLFTTLVGWMLVGTALILQILGYLWIRKIINIDI